MKKFVLLTMMLVSNMLLTFAQDEIILYIADYPEDMRLCLPDNQLVYIYAQDGCEDFHWSGYPLQEHANPFIVDPQEGDFWYISYNGCDGFHHGFGIEYVNSPVPNSFTHHVWKRQGELTELEAVGQDTIDYPLDWPYFYSFQWSTGEMTKSITVTQTGTYSVEITGPCGTATRTFIVRDNVELYRPTVDLETKLNKVTWQTIPEQTEYISEVKVERDGMVVGTAPYEQGYFLDNIGSENAARNYRLTAITTDGTECPIPSYQKGTLHVDYSPNASNPNKLNMAWTPPFIEEGASISVSYFQICKYDPATNEVTVVDQLGANNTIGSYDVNLFDGGYAVVAAMFNEGKEYEELSFSNLTDFLVGIEENEGPSTGSGTLTVYPNPAKGRFTVEGAGTMTVTNTLGQTVLTQEIDEKATVELPQGMYFVKLGGATRKVVVE